MWVGWVHHSWRFGHAEALREVGPEMPKRGSNTSTVPVVWATSGIFFGTIQIISCRDWWPWTKPGYITITRRQSNNQWSGGIAAHPAQETSKCKNRLEESSSRFFGIKTASFSLIIFEKTKLSTPSITHLCWCNWRTFWRKDAAERSPRGSCSCMTMPRLTGHLQPKRNWPTWASNVLITHPTLRISTRRTTTCSLDWKNNWKVAIFNPTRTSKQVSAATETCLDGQTSDFFFEWLAKVRVTG